MVSIIGEILHMRNENLRFIKWQQLAERGGIAKSKGGAWVPDEKKNNKNNKEEKKEKIFMYWLSWGKP